MESYRNCEKEGKRAKGGDHSYQDDKASTKTWILKNMQTLKSQTTQLDNELKLKASDVSALERIITIEHILDRNRFHIAQLEKILRGFDDDKIDQDQIEQIREPLTEYIERNQVRSFLSLHIYIIFISLKKRR